MGFLDDLKRQADALQATRQDDAAERERRIQLVDAVAQETRRYLMDLAAQLTVIKPSPAVTYRLDKRLQLQGLPRHDFRFDARRKAVGDHERIDHIVMACRVGDGQRVRLTKDFVNEIEQLERRLRQAGIAFDAEAVRHPTSGKLVEMRYDFPAEVHLVARVDCDHEQGELQFTLRNLDGLETSVARWPAQAVNQARLDELARRWVGQPHRFLDGATSLQRIDAG